MSYGLVNEWTRILIGEGISLTLEGLFAALQNPGLHIRTGAAIILGRSNEDAAVPYLKPLLKDELIVRVEAAMSLVLLKDTSGLPVLVEILDADMLTGAPITAAGYLASLGDPRGYYVVLRALNSEFTGNRLMAAVTLKKFLPFHKKELNREKMDLFEILKKALADPVPLVRCELLYKLAKLDDRRSPILLSDISLSDSDRGVRQIARRLLSPVFITHPDYKSLNSELGTHSAAAWLQA